MSRKFFILLGSLIALLLIPSTVFATSHTATINSAVFACDSVEINYTIDLNFGTYNLEVRDGPNGTGTVLGSLPIGIIAGTFNSTINLSPQPVDGTTLYIFIQKTPSPGSINPAGTSSGNCVAPLVTTTDEVVEEVVIPTGPPPYHFFGGEGTYAGIYIQAEENGTNNPILALYNINEESQGSLLFYLSLNSLNSDYPADAGVNTLIYENPEEFITLYRLSTGELQVNLGPDNEGKMHVMRFNWDGGEPYNVVYETYFASSYRFEWAGLLSSSILSR